VAKIPKHAKKVFEGVIFDIYQWDQEMYDGSHEVFEMAKRKANGVVVIPILENGEILYSKQEQPMKPTYYALFGGMIDEGEDKLSGAKRELLEESGYESDDWEYLFTYDKFGKVEWEIHYYIARNCYKTSMQKLDPGEKIEIKQSSLDYFIEEVLPLDNFQERQVQGLVMKALDHDAVEELKEKLLKSIKA
jgi:ADP-ribose pyrophosphatase